MMRLAAILALLVLAASVCAAQDVDRLSPQSVTRPGALYNPQVSGIVWSPVGATMTYLKPDGGVVGGDSSLWAYDAVTGKETLLYDPKAQPVGATHASPLLPTTAQWSPNGDAVLLSDGNDLWLIDVATDTLRQVTHSALPEQEVTWKSVLERHLTRVRLDGTQLTRLTETPGTHFATLSADGQYLTEVFQSVTQTPITSLLRSDGTPVRVLGDSKGTLSLSSRGEPNGAQGYAAPTVDFVTLKTADGVDLYGELFKPADFDAGKKYPVVVYTYAGPTIQLVANRSDTTSLLNPQPLDLLMLQQGYLVWRLDNRGTIGRGHAFQDGIFKNLGKLELQDQLTGVAYLKSLPFVDPGRLAILGRSYGGFMTLYALVHAPGVFRCATASAPVTDWNYYDTIYTERYMHTPAENPQGYQESSLVNLGPQVQDPLFVIFGTADDNVQTQNTVNFLNGMMQAYRPFDVLILPGQNHDFYNDGLTASIAATMAFFEQRL
jgi:dipeptidyl-peptidase-4